MKITELRKKPKEEIQKIIRDDREKLRQLRFDLSAGKVKNVKMNVEEQKKADSLIQSMFGEDLYPTNFSIDCGPKIKNQIEDRSSHANCIREDKFHKRDLVTELRSFLR